MATVIYLNHDELKSALRLCYRAELMATKAGSFVRMPAVIWGDPGIGKTSVARMLAKELFEGFDKKGIEAGFWPISLAYKEVTDIAGFPVPDHETKTMTYFPPDDLPYINKHLKLQTTPYGIIVLDDVDRTQTDTRNGAMSLLLDRSLNGNPISPNVYVCATANGESDPGTTSPLGGAFGNRLVHLYLRPHEGWSKFLGDKSITSVEEMLPMKQTSYQEIAMCTPRSVEMAKWVIKARTDESRMVVRAVLNGCVGDTAGAILTKVGLRTFCLDDVLNQNHIDTNRITFDDVEMLRRELDMVAPLAKPSVKVTVNDWAKTLPNEFGNIVLSTVINW